MWGAVRMSPRDIADVTGSTYTYLMNGRTPEDDWQALFNVGEKVRLRIINGSAMTYFDFRIPGLEMTVVAAVVAAADAEEKLLEVYSAAVVDSTCLTA